MRLRNIKDVVDWRLCLGCGVCAYICPESKIKLVDMVNDGIRPIVADEGCGPSCECLLACPGAEISHSPAVPAPGSIAGLQQGWGPVLEIWEGYSADQEIRFHGSSAGLATALALYCLEKEAMYGVMHIAGDAEIPWRNKTVLSRDREALLKGTGSRYAPASPCDSLDQIEAAPKPCVFVGKPCDVAGLRKAQALRPQLNGKIGIAIGIFCAGTPSTQGTLDLLQQCNVDPGAVAEIRYRGNGWPGRYTVRQKGEEHPAQHMSYQSAWGFLQKYRPYRCHLCPDGTGEFADLSCGDPWYREIEEDEPGYSLLVVRTERGRKILHAARDAGYVVLARAENKKLEQAQKNLLGKRSAIWGRLIAMQAFGIPVPRLRGFSLFRNWCNLSITAKLRSIFGTAKRVIMREYYKPRRFYGHAKPETDKSAVL
ncbi:MAG: Coenzyme F420 hydrogenase/dehydrogenase, beta subunit C-terminal domain [bacterium]